MFRLLFAGIITTLTLFAVGGLLFLIFSFLGIVVSFSTLLPVFIVAGVLVLIPVLLLGGAFFAIVAIPLRVLFSRGRNG